MRLRIYLDTSVFSALYDERAPERRGQTEEFWERREQFEVATSELNLARQELEQTPDPVRRADLRHLLEGVTGLHGDEETGSKVRPGRHVYRRNIQ